MNRGDKCFSLATIQLQTRSPACLSQCRKTWWRNILHFSWAVRYVSRPCAKQGSDWGGRGRRARGLWPWYQPMAHCLRPVPGKWWGQTEGRGTPEWGCRSWWGIQSSLLLYCRPQSGKGESDFKIYNHRTCERVKSDTIRIYPSREYTFSFLFWAKVTF